MQAAVRQLGLVDRLNKKQQTCHSSSSRAGTSVSLLAAACFHGRARTEWQVLGRRLAQHLPLWLCLHQAASWMQYGNGGPCLWTWARRVADNSTEGTRIHSTICLTEGRYREATTHGSMATIQQ